MDTRAEVLVTAMELARRLDANEPVTILDVRWRLDEPDGRAAYQRSHLPGAVYVSLEDELSDPTVTGRGRHPLPSPCPPGGALRQPPGDGASVGMCRLSCMTTGIEPVRRGRGGY